MLEDHERAFRKIGVNVYDCMTHDKYLIFRGNRGSKYGYGYEATYIYSMDHEKAIELSIRPDNLKVEKNVLYKETNSGISMYNIDPEYLSKLFSQQDLHLMSEKEYSDEERGP